ncbi:CD3324 family protein [Paenibacillus doosanensis]|uniref:CD3324 family protein n=1 Tax=Paenibacillus doosanensis TaxID=1229154 RepID=UPI00217F5CB3|nr:CD3324 family protein [Paenibacillus doosanensis]MCS7459413.1 CD3324 family protein [Paenibacillus doosanensis]
MKYMNAVTVLPEELVKEIQKYIKGGILYIPFPEETHKKWGQNSGSRKYLHKKNHLLQKVK